MASSSPDAERLKQLFAQAAEIAAGVPEAMQDAAFNRALDQLLADTSPPSGQNPDKPARRGAKTPRTAPKKGADMPVSDESPTTRLVAEINRTAYPEIFSVSNALDRSLRILRLADVDFGVEFLSAPEIAQILVEKFRLPTSHQAVRQALGTKPQYVDTTQVFRGSRGRAVLAYRIMSPGIDFLDAGGSAAQEGGSTPSRSRPTKARPKKSKGSRQAASAAERAGTNAEAEATGTGKSKKNASTASARKKGPKAALTELITEGYFDEPRLIGDARERLRHKKGLSFTLQDLSPALVRLLRERSLDREQNESGQYEYRRP